MDKHRTHWDLVDLDFATADSHFPSPENSTEGHQVQLHCREQDHFKNSLYLYDDVLIAVQLSALKNTYALTKEHHQEDLD